MCGAEAEVLSPKTWDSMMATPSPAAAAAAAAAASPAMRQAQKSPLGGLSLSLKRIVSGEELSELEGRANGNAVNGATEHGGSRWPREGDAAGGRVPEEIDGEEEDEEEEERRRTCFRKGLASLSIGPSAEDIEAQRKLVERSMSYDAVPGTLRHDLHGPMSARFSTSGLSPKYNEEIFDLEHNAVKVRDNDAEFCQDSNAAADVETAKPKATKASPAKKGPKIGPDDFDILCLVGEGAFGKVYQVMKKSTNEIYAMKVMRKDRILEKNHQGYMRTEREVLTVVRHPFVVELHYSFQTPTRLYLVLDFVNGGHLFFQLYKQGFFMEDLARFYTAEIVLAVSHLHKQGIMHRDLKPENILLDLEGHVRITDFGLAKNFADDDNRSTRSLCGTMEYMSPEVIVGKPYGEGADWWSVAVLLYEMLTGQPPFQNRNREALSKKILKEKVKFPKFLTSDAVSLLRSMLMKDESKRLGSARDGGDEIKKQSFFRKISFAKVLSREIEPPFKPTVEQGLHDTANFDADIVQKSINKSSIAAGNEDELDSDPFAGYSYISPGLLAQWEENNSGELSP